jgi:hypothetical protein
MNRTQTIKSINVMTDTKTTTLPLQGQPLKVRSLLRDVLDKEYYKHAKFLMQSQHGNYSYFLLRYHSSFL